MIIEYMGRHGFAPGMITHVIMIYRPELVDHMRANGVAFIEVDETSADPDRRYVDERQIKDRPVAPIALTASQIVADGADTAMLQGVPAGWEIRMDGSPFGIADGTDIEIVSSEPHAYAIEIVGPWPFQPWRGQVVAVAAG
ncbi:hypothetical protein AB4037_29300 [Labrys sp. KB_33_2]|uniref:hypothetical protein n=1 Tax=Labrys sp. KB_33_2 TaxID=3237479 RepID=UPI003F8D9945